MEIKTIPNAPYATDVLDKTKLQKSWLLWLQNALSNINNNLLNLYNRILGLTAIQTISSNTTLNYNQKHILVDASLNTVDITLPDASLDVGHEFVIHGFDATNTITVYTTSGQQIKTISTDTATSDNITSGLAVHYISNSTFWKKYL